MRIIQNDKKKLINVRIHLLVATAAAALECVCFVVSFVVGCTHTTEAQGKYEM